MREAYMNVSFKKGLPCIVTTNNIKMFTFMMKSDYFKYDCMFWHLKDYIGPE